MAPRVATSTQLVDALSKLPNLLAIVLVGSHATGPARSNSDLDIGLYFRQSRPFSIDQVRICGGELRGGRSDARGTGFYEWGPWVNGGARVTTPTGQVDFLYRHIDQLQTVIDESRLGVWRHDYDQQPPFGFRSVVYLGESHICVPLYDPEGEIAS